MRYFQKQPPDVFCKKRCLQKFRKFYRKTLMLESTFNNVEGLQACIFIRIRLQQRCFPVNIAKFLRAHILKYICERLLRYSEIYTSNNQIYILAEKFILGFTKYFIICSALPTLAPLNYVFLLHFSRILFSTFFTKFPMFRCSVA